MHIEGTRYSLHVTREIGDGPVLECYRETERGKELVMTVRRSDARLQFLVSQHAAELPLAVVEQVTAAARERLGGFVA